ncbi:unnamed protein product [Toxocara canis]|uniref:Kinesin-like protein n=1 Tax=Toxocara canis TaxID=6265 RepID=A0A183VC79_TOXCA|nr:unnamed protein product [Toxocara canis]
MFGSILPHLKDTKVWIAVNIGIFRHFQRFDPVTGRISSLNPRNKQILKGISVLSLDFGTLSEENLSLKESLLDAKRTIRMLQLQLAPYKKVVVNVDADCQTDVLLADDEGIDVKSVEGSEKEENNNVNIVKANHETTLTLRRNIKELLETKDELKMAVDELREGAIDELGRLRITVETLINNYVGNLVIRYQKQVDARKNLHNRLVEMNGNIRIFCRIRPSSVSEQNDKALIQIDPIDNGVLTVEMPSGDKKIFDEVSPVITSCIDGYNVCILAYGHTGSGKTYTMEGPPHDPGINQRSLVQLFETVAERSDDFHYTILISMLEIYNEKIRDLLSKSKSNLSIRICDTGALEIRGLSSVEVRNVDDVQRVLEKGRLNRVVAVTEVNDHSSRSHAIVRVTVRSQNRTTNAITEGRLNLIDLAGSERVSQSGATGQQLKEAQYINRSLSELGNVMSALRQHQPHIPFRNCQLTRLLEDCLS